MDSLQPAFFMLLPSLPIMIVHIVGIVISATKMGRYRKAATLGMAGFVCLLVAQLIRAASSLMTLPAFRGSTPMRELSTRFTIFSVAATTVVVGGTILLLLAIFAGRDKRY